MKMGSAHLPDFFGGVMLDFGKYDLKEERRTDRIIKYHFEHKLNNAEIAKLVDCSRENVRQILQRLGVSSHFGKDKNEEE